MFWLINILTECFKVYRLIQAALGNLLVRKVFVPPFAGCSRDFSREYRGFYGVERSGNYHGSAHVSYRWIDSVLTDNSRGRTGSTSLASK